MPWNQVAEAEITNLETGEKEVAIVKEWARDHGFSPDSCYSASRRDANHRGYHFKWLRTVQIDREPRTISETVKNQIVNGYRSGMSIGDLKKKLHLGSRTITGVLHDKGIETSKRPCGRKEAYVAYYDHEIKDLGKFRALVNAGWHPANIADEFNTSVSKVEKKKRELRL